MPPCNAGEIDAVEEKSSQIAVSKSRHVASRRGVYARRKPAMATAAKLREPMALPNDESAAPVPVGVPAGPVAETGVEATGAVVVGATVARVLLA
jgi:hypothetical protein